MNYPIELSTSNITPKHKIIQYTNILQINNLHSTFIRSLLILTDNRIATSGGKSISICSLNPFNKQWTQDINKQNIHNEDIKSINELKPYILGSCSSDKTIKIWSISQTDLTLLKTLTSHTNIVWSIIPFQQNIFASCSKDCTIKIWETNNNSFQELTSLSHRNEVRSIMYIQQRSILVSCLNSPSNCILFWNTNTLEHTGKIIKEHFAFNSSHMISLPNGNLVISSKSDGNPIIVVDTVKYIIIRIIYLRGFITGYSSICVVNNYSFIYVYDGNIVQVDNCEYNILSCDKQGYELYGYGGVCSFNEGKFLVIQNIHKGISIIELGYK